MAFNFKQNTVVSIYRIAVDNLQIAYTYAENPFSASKKVQIMEITSFVIK